MCDGCMSRKGRNVSSQPEIQNYYSEENNLGNCVETIASWTYMNSRRVFVVVSVWFGFWEVSVRERRRKIQQHLEVYYNYGIKIKVDSRSWVGTFTEIEKTRHDIIETK